jgi:hypothetical protein
VKRKGQSFTVNLLASVALLFLFSINLQAQNGAAASTERPIGSISEIAHKRRALLLVKRAGVVDARGGISAVIEEALKSDPRQSRRYRLAFATIASKLNKFIRKYKSLTPVERLEEADYVIFFNLLEYRRPLGVPYPYGELFVIVNPQPGAQGGPRVVWKSRKAQWAEDAVDELLDELRLMR